MTNETEKNDRPFRAAFWIGDDPFTITEYESQKTNVQFLKAFRPDFFSFKASLYHNLLSDAEAMDYAAMSIRMSYLHAAETVMAFTLAALQAPQATFAWLHKYRIDQLIKLVEKVSSGQKIPSRWKSDPSSWSDVARMVLQRVPSEIKSSSGETFSRQFLVESFSRSLGYIASEFLDKNLRGEYNEAKHGFRLSMGGFSLAFQNEVSPGVVDSNSSPTILSSERFGSTSFVAEPFDGHSHHLRVKTSSRNWKPHQDALKLHVMSLWLSNLRQSLLCELGETESKPCWVWSSDKGIYDDPWLTTPGVGFVSMKLGEFEFEGLESKEKLTRLLRSKKE